MPAHAESFSITTRGKGTYEITERCQQIIRASGVNGGKVANWLLQDWNP